MLMWQIGDVTIRCCVEIEMQLPIDGLLTGVDLDRLAPHRSWLSPAFVDADDQMSIAIQSMLIESAGKRIVVDTCLGNDRHIGDLPTLHTEFLDLIAGVGFGRERVDYVLCTHLHTDHVGWNTMLVDGEWVPTFPSARYLFGATEHEFWRDHEHDSIVTADTVDPVVDAGLADFVPTDFRLTPDVRLVPTPGHTPGHVSVLIESQGESAMISGDVLHNPLQMIDPVWGSLPDWDPSAAASTRRRVLGDLADTSTLLIGTHFAAPTAGYVRSDGVGAFVFSDAAPARDT
jgi:glyoxylase-like metal-dependent hydrolase (beta-lactamase superfamily II)